VAKDRSVIWTVNTRLASEKVMKMSVPSQWIRTQDESSQRVGIVGGQKGVMYTPPHWEVWKEFLVCIFKDYNCEQGGYVNVSPWGWKLNKQGADKIIGGSASYPLPSTCPLCKVIQCMILKFTVRVWVSEPGCLWLALRPFDVQLLHLVRFPIMGTRGLLWGPEVCYGFEHYTNSTNPIWVWTQNVGGIF